MRTVFVDVDSQLDFLYPAGALYVPQAERIGPAIAGLTRFAAANGIPVVCTADAHSENDPEFEVWPHHCVAGTWGQRKAESTLLEKRVVIPNRPGLPALDGAQQFIVEKQTVDVFLAPNLPLVLDHLGATHCVVYGVVTEICVLHAARGLLRTGRKVTVIRDAVETLKAEDSERAFAEMCSGAVVIATASQICVPEGRPS